MGSYRPERRLCLCDVSRVEFFADGITMGTPKVTDEIEVGTGREVEGSTGVYCANRDTKTDPPPPTGLTVDRGRTRSSQTHRVQPGASVVFLQGYRAKEYPPSIVTGVWKHRGETQGTGRDPDGV